MPKMDVRVDELLARSGDAPEQKQCGTDDDEDRYLAEELKSEKQWGTNTKEEEQAKEAQEAQAKEAKEAQQREKEQQLCLRCSCILCQGLGFQSDKMAFFAVLIVMSVVAGVSIAPSACNK